MKKIFLTILILAILQCGSSVFAAQSRWDELSQKAKDLRYKDQYSEALKTYEKLLHLTQGTDGKQSTKAAEILIEMSLIYRYNLNNEKKYDELQGEAKKIQMTLNGTLSCREPSPWRYDQCRERWLGPDPCFEYEENQDRIKVTYYGLGGSDFKTPQDFIEKLKGLFRKFEAMDAIKFKGQDATRIKLRYDGGDYRDYDGRYIMPEFRYEEFLILPLKQGFLVFNFNMNHHVPIPGTFSKDGAPKALYDDAYENYQIWSSFLENCSVINGRA